MDVSMEQAASLREMARTVVSKLADVASVGITGHDNAWALKVNLRHQRVPNLPAQIEGVPVVYDEYFGHAHSLEAR